MWPVGAENAKFCRWGQPAILSRRHDRKHPQFRDEISFPLPSRRSRDRPQAEYRGFRRPFRCRGGRVPVSSVGRLTGRIYVARRDDCKSILQRPARTAGRTARRFDIRGLVRLSPAERLRWTGLHPLAGLGQTQSLTQLLSEYSVVVYPARASSVLPDSGSVQVDTTGLRLRPSATFWKLRRGCVHLI